MNTFLKLHLSVVAFLGAASLAYSQTTAFTYNGRLNNAGAPVNGAHDMRFSVYDTAAGGLLVAGPVPVNAVDVANGLFTARIDFGAGVFTGPPRWLEISVRQGGNGAFTTLSPRQELTSSPYAIRAQSAGTAADVSNGSVVKSLNNLRDNVSLVAGANVTLTPSGNTITIASSGGNGPWLPSGSSVFYNGGNVGIGTSTPQGLLDIAAGNGSDTSALFVRADPGTFGRGGIIHHQSATYGWQELAQTTGSATDGFLGFNYVDRTAPGTKIASTVLALRGNGCVGIGTAAPGTKLTVFSSAYGIEHTDGDVRLSTYLNAGGWLGTVSNHRLHFFVNDGGPSMTIDTARNVGIGTMTPQAKLHLYSTFVSTAHRIETGAGVNAWSRTEYANANGQWNVGTSRSFNGDQLYFHREGSPNIALGIQPNGDAFLQGTMSCKVLTITGGADIAEPFKMTSGEIPKGSVVVIDEANAGNLKLSTEAYDKRVAGIVSGANGIRPGISLHQEGAIEGNENVALSGRVYVQADAAFGAIKPGDLLTTSDTAGHAMKVTNHSMAQGAILGKAMGSLKQGKGMVLVLVTLQ